MNIAIIGLGLIGGSLGKDLASQLNVHVLGVDQNDSHGRTAKDLNLIHELVSYEDAVQKADVILICIPVTALQKLLPQLLNDISDETIVIDMGSTKSNICNAVTQHHRRGRFVAAHPLAGTEFSGPEAAISGLFRGKKNIICNKEESDTDAVETALNIFRSLGMTTVYMDATEHDRHIAYVSHLSHVTSFTLGLTVLDIEKDEKQIFNLASTGFASTVRLAKSNPTTWSSIFENNSEHLTNALEHYIHQLSLFKEAIEDQNIEVMHTLMTKANSIKGILETNINSNN